MSKQENTLYVKSDQILVYYQALNFYVEIHDNHSLPCPIHKPQAL